MTQKQFRNALFAGHYRLWRYREPASEMLDYAIEKYSKYTKREIKFRTRDATVRDLKAYVAEQFKAVHGTGIWVMLLIQFVLPLVVKLLVEWMFSNRNGNMELMRSWKAAA